MRDLTGLIKAYDIRGTVPDQLDAGPAPPSPNVSGARLIAVGLDMRVSSPELAAVAVAVGLASTDQPTTTQLRQEVLTLLNP
jgi:phosphomannomutase